MTLLDDTSAVLDTGPVCDACLGRCFADRGRGVTNEERGSALRMSLAMQEDEPFEPVEPDACWVCGGLRPDYDGWADRAMDALGDLRFDTFLVGTHVPSALEENESELRTRTGLNAEAGEPLKAELNREVGKRIEETTEAAVDHEDPDVVAILNLETEEVDLQINPEFLYGRYRKLESGLPQRTRVCRVCGGSGTQWREGEAQPCENCDGSGSLTEESVEQFITGPILERMGGSEAVFNCAGREGDDVLVREAARPFVVEVKEPRRRPPDLDQLMEEIDRRSDGAIEVEGLALADKEVVEHLTQTPIRQTYRLTVALGAAVSSEEYAAAIDGLDHATVHQKVERGDRTSEQIRTLGEVRGSLTDGTTGSVELDSKAGVDLEALVTGGEGRSDPNLADLLGTDLDVIEVEVVAIEGEEASIEPAEHLRR